ncbi:hypothetical protein L7F22_009762 [Adiantum nelumboides]|nr:hypothetical protein [Adiantum nelumboides]
MAGWGHGTGARGGLLHPVLQGRRPRRRHRRARPFRARRTPGRHGDRAPALVGGAAGRDRRRGRPRRRRGAVGRGPAARHGLPRRARRGRPRRAAVERHPLGRRRPRARRGVRRAAVGGDDRRRPGGLDHPGQAALARRARARPRRPHRGGVPAARLADVELRGGGVPGGAGLDELVTDRSDASGTGWFDGVDYRPELLERFFGSTPALPRLLGPAESVDGPGGIRVGAGAGDNAAAGLGVDAGDDVVVSLGTSGTVFARSERRAQDPSGIVAGFSDATGAYLPLVCTLNASRVLDATRRLLGVDHDELGRLALAAEPGAGGLVVVPYLEGERTPNLPDATGAMHGWTLASGTRENLARAAVEGMLSAQRVGLEALREQGVTVSGVTLVGGAARSEAVCRIAAQVFEVPVRVPEPGEYVADGAARQAAWALHGGATPPSWSAGAEPARYEADPAPAAWERYREAAGAFLDRVAG